MFIDRMPGRRGGGGRRKARSNFGNAGCRLANAILDAYHHLLPLFSAELQAFGADFPYYEADLCTVSISTPESWCGAKEATRREG
jgi:hypothetical protein